MDSDIKSFFEQPIINLPYAYPGRHWQLDGDGQPTNRILETRRRSDLITPVPKPNQRPDEGERVCPLRSSNPPARSLRQMTASNITKPGVIVTWQIHKTALWNSP